jgi:hypothetical protein
MEKPEKNWHTVGFCERVIHFDRLNGVFIPITGLPVFLLHLSGWHVNQPRLQSDLGHQVKSIPFSKVHYSEQDMRTDTISPQD